MTIATIWAWPSDAAAATCGEDTGPLPCSRYQEAGGGPIVVFNTNEATINLNIEKDIANVWSGGVLPGDNEPTVILTEWYTTILSGSPSHSLADAGCSYGISTGAQNETGYILSALDCTVNSDTVTFFSSTSSEYSANLAHFLAGEYDQMTDNYAWQSYTAGPGSYAGSDNYITITQPYEGEAFSENNVNFNGTFAKTATSTANNITLFIFKVDPFGGLATSTTIFTYDIYSNPVGAGSYQGTWSRNMSLTAGEYWVTANLVQETGDFGFCSFIDGEMVCTGDYDQSIVVSTTAVPFSVAYRAFTVSSTRWGHWDPAIGWVSTTSTECVKSSDSWFSSFDSDYLLCRVDNMFNRTFDYLFRPSKTMDEYLDYIKQLVMNTFPVSYFSGTQEMFDKAVDSTTSTYALTVTLYDDVINFTDAVESATTYVPIEIRTGISNGTQAFIALLKVVIVLLSLYYIFK